MLDREASKLRLHVLIYLIHTFDQAFMFFVLVCLIPRQLLFLQAKLVLNETDLIGLGRVLAVHLVEFFVQPQVLLTHVFDQLVDETFFIRLFRLNILQPIVNDSLCTLHLVLKILLRLVKLLLQL